MGHEHQDGISADGHGPLEGEPTAEQQRGGKTDQDGHSNQRCKRRRKTNSITIGITIGVAQDLNATQFVFFSREGLHRRHPREIVFEQCIHLACSASNTCIPWFKTALVSERTPNDEGNGKNGKQGHLPRDGNEHGTHNDHSGADLEEVVGPLIQKTLKLVDVIVEDGEDIAFLTLIKPRHALTLHVVKRVQPKLVLNRLSKVSPEHTVEVFEQRFKAPNEEGQDGESHQLVPRIDQSGGGQQRSFSSTTTSTASPISNGGAKSQNLLKIEQKEARRTVPRCGRM